MARTEELTGAMLDAAVAKAMGREFRIGPYRVSGGYGITFVRDEPVCMVGVEHFEPSASWTTGGPIIDREHISTTYPEESPSVGYEWHANLARPDASFNSYGPTPLIAAMRAFVTSKLGDEVEL